MSEPALNTGSNTKSVAAVIADVAWGSSVGRRPDQEDYCAVMSWPNDFRLLLLADGMGGAVGGAIASRLVVERFRDAFIADADSDTPSRLLTGLQNANQSVQKAIAKEPWLDGMGTTLVALAFDGGNGVHWLSVGDSPLWLYRKGEIRRLNQNHSVAGRLDAQAAAGEITWEQAAASDERHQLLEAITGHPIELIDAPKQPFEILAGDTILLASDGVETCSLRELEEAVVSVGQDAKALTDDILQRVKAHDKMFQDNASLIVMAVHGKGDEPVTVRAASQSDKEPSSEQATKPASSPAKKTSTETTRGKKR